MKKFFKNLLGITAVIIFVLCALIVYQLVTGEEISLPFTEPYNPMTQTSDTSSEIPEETAGGNDGGEQYTYYKVTVSEDRYFTADGELTFEELADKISSFGDDFAVEIADDNATLKAYKALTDMLDEKSVPYTENGV